MSDKFVEWKWNEGPDIVSVSQSWIPWRSHLSPRPVRRSSARRWRPVSLDLPRRESTITSHRVSLNIHPSKQLPSREVIELCVVHSELLIYSYLPVSRAYPVVWVGGELLAGLVPGWVWAPLPGFRPARPAGQWAVWPGKRCFPGPDGRLHRRRDPVGASGDHEERWRHLSINRLSYNLW